MQKTLTELRKDELIAPRSWSVRDAEKGVTAPQLARWSLTPKGHALVKPSAQYPVKPSHPRQRRLVEHDARTIATVVHLLLVARRTGLRGVFLRYEVRLAPDRPRPIADAFVCIQTGASGAAPNIVPWSNDPALHDEERWRFVIEGDNATEPAATIRGKGEAYRQLFSDPQWRHAWQAQFGPLPFVLWVVPEEARSTVIREHFSAGTHQGLFYLTTDAGLTENSWLQVEHGQVKRVGLRMPTPALPPPPPSIPALPAPGQAQIRSAHATAEPSSSANVTNGDRVVTTGATTTIIAPPAMEPTAIAPSATIIQAPTAADYAAAEAWQRAQRWHWWRGWIEGGVERFGRALWWLVCLLPRPLHGLWTWCETISDETRSAVWRVLLGAFLVGLMWAVIVQPPHLVALTRTAILRISGVVAPAIDPITPAPTPPPATATACPQMRVRGTRVNLRAEPGLSGKVLRQLHAGDVVTVLDCATYTQDGQVWWRVDDGTGAGAGWIAAAWLARIP